MRIGVANNAGCLVTAVKIYLITPYPGMVSKCLFSTMFQITYPSIIHAVIRSGAFAQGVALKNDSPPWMSPFETRN